MFSRRPLKALLVTSTAIGIGAWLSVSPAIGQHTPDPYNIVGEYNNQYEPFMYAREPNDESLFPNQNRLRERPAIRSANRFQSYLDGMENVDGRFDTGANARRSGGGSPYFQAYRKYDEGFKRIYKPNEKADENFFTDLDQRNQKYFEARKETDPKKRAQLLREYNMEKLRAARLFSAPRSGVERMSEGSRLDRPSSPFSAVEEPATPKSETGRPEFGARPRTTTRGAVRDTLPPLSSPRASSTIPPLRAPESGRLSAPRPPQGRPSPSTSGRTPAAGASPSSVLERNSRFDGGEPTSTTAPPPPR